MAGSDDRGLDLRLPWGRPTSEEPKPPSRKRQATEPAGRPRPVRADPVEPEPTSATGRSETDPVPLRTQAAPEALHLTDPRGAAFATQVDARLERLELGLSARLDRLEQQADTHDAGLEARLEKLQNQLLGAGDASLEAVGMLAGQLLARLEEQITGIEQALQTRNARLEAQASDIGLALQARHEMLVERLTTDMGQRHQDLVARVDAGHRAALEAMRGLASGPLVDRLLEGVVALGEVLDADLVNLRRLITQEHLGPSRPAVLLPDLGGAAIDEADGADLEQPAGPPSETDDDEPLP